ncbi:MAG: hypothetical protein KDJ77_18355 [Rhodobiaceae bacterium]|nr:hypothetical protein [Rhodobiaceae bacterium]
MVNPVLWRNLGKVHNTDTATDDHIDPKVIQLTNGNVVVAYFTDAPIGGSNPAGFDIAAKIYSSTGDLVRDEFILNYQSTDDDEFDFELAADPSGGFSVIYEDRGISGDASYNIRIDRFFASGDHDRGDGFLFDGDNTADGIFYRNPSVTAQSSAAILGTYEKYDTNTDKVGIYGKIFNAGSGSVTAEFGIATNYDYNGGTETIRGHSTTTLTTGEHVVVFADGDAELADEIYFQILNTDGSKTGQPGLTLVDNSLVDAYDPHVVGLSNGNFVVTWTGDSSGGSNTGIRARIYNDNGVAQTAVFTPATTLGGNQLYSSVGALENGRFVVVWYHQDGVDIRAQVYNADGTKDGTETVLVNDSPPSSIHNIDVEGFDDGRFQITWQVDPLGAVDYQVYSRIFDPRTEENSPNVYTTDQVIGTVNGDVIAISSADDYVNGWTGDDIFDFNVASDITAGDQFIGYTGTDVIRVTLPGTFDFRSATLSSFGKLEFYAEAASSDKTVHFDSTQIGTGLSSAALIDGNNSPDADDTLEIHLSMGTSVNLSGFTFQDWQVNSDNTDTLRVTGDASSETIIGSSMADELLGNGGNDAINGGGGDDLILGGTGADAIDGGAGNDTASYANSGVGVNVQMQYNVFSGGEATGDTLTNIEHLQGSAFNDTLYGNPGDNIIRGGAGADHIKGLNGADNLYGDLGDDWIYIDSLDNAALGGGGTDRLIVVNGNGVTNSVGTNSFEIATGNTGDDRFYGGAATADLTLRGRAGDDILHGGTGDDYLYGESGADQLRGGSGLDRLFVDENDTVIDGGVGSDDRVIVQQLASATVGVTLDMHAANVEVAYGNFNDDTFNGSSSTVALSLYGRQGQDTLTGGSANDRLYGDGNDTSAGDILNGGQGNDYLTGGLNPVGGFAERDQFVFDDNWGNDRIFDFANNAFEKIDFSSVAGITQRSDLTITDGAGYALISYADGGGWTASIRVDGVTEADLQSNDFIFV